jgi:hypothetical protein
MRFNIAWDRIEQFCGYGRADAPVVFLGMEEGQAVPGNLLADLRHRSKFDPIMDLREAHLEIDGTAQYFDHVNGSTQRTWRPMCELMIRREDAAATPNRRARLRYQSLQLGRSHGNSLLTELLPYPKRTSSGWPDIYRSRFRTRAIYERQVLPQRIKLVAELLARHPRDLIICYGKGNWTKYQQLANVVFRVSTRHWKVVGPREKNPRALALNVGNTRVVLVKHFCCKDFNTDAQLEQFASVALA